jgi:regulator of nucleoside diphosphate kinase
MTISAQGGERPPIHLLASESDLVAGLALRTEHKQPVVAAMLLEEIERAELHDDQNMPVAEGRISILTPMGAALYGLSAGACITWPDLEGFERPIRIVRVEQPGAEAH